MFKVYKHIGSKTKFAPAVKKRYFDPGNRIVVKIHHYFFWLQVLFPADDLQLGIDFLQWRHQRHGPLKVRCQMRPAHESHREQGQRAHEPFFPDGFPTCEQTAYCLFTLAM